MLPGGSVNSAAGSGVGCPAASSSQGCGSTAPSPRSRPVSPLVVVLVLTSSSTGSPCVGNPAAMGLGVMNARVPPNGATLATEGSELCSTTTMSRAVTRVR